MTALVANGQLFAAMLAIVVFEAVALILWHRRTGSGLPPLDVVFHLAAGCWLLIAAWLAIAGTAWPWVLASLGASGIAHAVDLRRQIRRAAP